MKFLSLTFATESKFPSGSERNEEAADNAPRVDQCHGPRFISTFRSLSPLSGFSILF